LALVAVAQVRKHVCYVRKLLLEVALEALQALDQLWSAGEASAEEHAGATTPATVMMMVHYDIHLLSS
jgi:hypothetical protein